MRVDRLQRVTRQTPTSSGRWSMVLSSSPVRACRSSWKDSKKIKKNMMKKMLRVKEEP
jgi:hypothetical protein